MGGGFLVGLLNLLRQNLDSGSETYRRVTPGRFSGVLSPAKGVLTAVLKATSAAVTLGSGNSLGPEGPSVEIGASVGGGVGNVLRASRERGLSLVAAGSAAGISSGECKRAGGGGGGGRGGGGA